ncbi:putative methyltransferase BTM2-like [Apostichopus japonicus]|uniref:Putative methyltransferase BTM2-like n=1 Tax=Stichopus japonicus TaxID=307972 RepID=A0A2G8LR67_STIJA|nr:putative methyltransferase BTM2-like [Apostichopus japonicus]
MHVRCNISRKNIWSTDHPDDRIKWSHQTCMKYFFDGGLAQTLQKDRRRRDFQHKVSTSKPSVLCNSKNGLHGNGVSAKTASEDALERISTQYNTISLPFSGQLRLLDVGSCFNPFLDYPEFLSIGIDISPAVTSVYKCDFLNLQLQEPLQVYSDTVNRYLQMLKNPVTTLPESAFTSSYFHYSCPISRRRTSGGSVVRKPTNYFNYTVS